MTSPDVQLDPPHSIELGRCVVRQRTLELLVLELKLAPFEHGLDSPASVIVRKGIVRIPHASMMTHRMAMAKSDR